MGDVREAKAISYEQGAEYGAESLRVYGLTGATWKHTVAATLVPTSKLAQAFLVGESDALLWAASQVEGN